MLSLLLIAVIVIGPIGESANDKEEVSELQKDGELLIGIVAMTVGILFLLLGVALLSTNLIYKYKEKR